MDICQELIYEGIIESNLEGRGIKMITKEDLQKAKEMYEEVFGYDPKHGSLSAESTIAIVMLAKEIFATD